jgi:hypothetical protein
MCGLWVAVLGCMLHATFNRKWDVVRGGGAPLLFAFVLLTIVFGAAK